MRKELFLNFLNVLEHSKQFMQGSIINGLLATQKAQSEELETRWQV